MEIDAHHSIFQMLSKDSYNIPLQENPITFTISSEGSNAIVATKKKMNLIYFKKQKQTQTRKIKGIYSDNFKNVSFAK